MTAPRVSTGGGHALSHLRSFALRVVGGRVGAAILFGAVSFFGLYWQSGVFINDNFTLVNALRAVSDGRLYWQSQVSWPGTVTIDGRLYGRSYGIVVAALPFLWLLELFGPIVGVRFVAVGIWAVAVFGFAHHAGAVSGQRRGALLAAAGVVSVVALANALFAGPLDYGARFALALQLLAMVTTALIGVLVYRLLCRVESRTLGAFGGSAVVLATSVAYWASIPKRHVFTALLALLAVYGFAVSRTESEPRRGLVHRCLAYGAVGLTAWVNPAEAAVLFTVLLPLDVATAPSNDRMHLTGVGSAFALSLLPFLVTNTLVTGDPLTAPVMELTGFSGTGGGPPPSGGGGGGGGGGTTPLVERLGRAASPILDPLVLVWSVYADGLDVLLAEPLRLYQVFVDRGFDALTGQRVGSARNLSVLESVPFLAALVGALPSLRHEGRTERLRAWLASADGRTDAFVIVYVALFTLLYLPRLPLRVQLTVRYLVPVVPGLVYLVCRVPVVKRSLQRNQTAALWTYAYGVGVGSLVSVVLFRLGPTVGLGLSKNEIISMHGDIALLTAAALAVVTVAADVRDRDGLDRTVARLMALGAALGTVLVLVSFLHYWNGDLLLVPQFGS
ncbi:hypothetical protein [Halorarius halobius]|uniref:hypothetical protein n=1 Tax=Halorarius halobius TaxID=2962671 RepID=UPI0020CDDDA7|nr:hypothetical protein [Halorarius halobius]